VDTLQDVLDTGRLPAVVTAHGNLISLLLHHLDGRPGFDTWATLTNPDVYRLMRPSDTWTVERIWTD
jgi:2,3-bisphosphoglycerate-dependent phosphoglycerate mutase